MTNTHLNLETLISKETLKKSISSVILAFIVLLVFAIIFVVKQNDKSHQRSISQLSEKFDTSLSNFQQQVENLSTNDLIINSIVDYSNRDNYLPIFFRSLKLNNSTKTTITFNDFTGEIITGKNNALYEEISSHFDWQQEVLNNGKTFFEYSQRGIFVAAPVLLSQSPEGAITAYVENIQGLVHLPTSESLLVFIGKNNNVLFSSNNEALAIGSTFDTNQFQFWSKKQTAYLSGKIVSLTPPSLAYSNIIWLIIIISISLIAVFTGLMANVSKTAKYASEAMIDLKNTLAEAIRHNDATKLSSQSDNEPTEFIAIKKEFNTVLNNLFEQTVSLEKFTSVINSIGELLVVLDTEHNVILNNHSFNNFSTRTKLKVPDDLARIFPQEHLNHTNQDLNIDKSYGSQPNHINNESITIQWSVHQYIDNEGQQLGVIFVGKDISLAKQLEKELIIKNMAIDSAQTSVVITDAQQDNHPIIYANKAFGELTGYPVETILGKNCRFLQGKNTEKDRIESLKLAISNQQPITITLTNYKQDNSEFQNELTINPIANEQGIVTHYLGIQLDVTEREAAANYLKLAKQKAEESTQLKSEFLASMSHEIRTPMNGVIGMLDLLLNTQLDEEQLHNTEIAKNSANSLLSIINDILDFSKIESGKLTIENVAFDLHSVINEVAQVHAQQAQQKSIELIVDLTEVSSPLVSGDAGRVRQIINNLLSNAIKFTQHGDVTIKARLIVEDSQMSRLYCEVTDTGIGIANNRLTEVFDSFTQADSSTTRLYGGTGLGLAISAKLCGLMGGSIEVESQLNTGSCFSFNIPLATPLHKERKPLLTLENNNIIIFDSALNSAKILAKQLTIWGAHVSLISNEQDFVDACNEPDIDLIFISNTENKNPQTAVIKQLSSAVKQHTTFVLMHKITESISRAQLIESECSYALAKPVTTNNLSKLFTQISNNINHPNPSIEFFEETITDEPKTSCNTEILLVEDNRTNQLVAKKLLASFGAQVTVANNGEEALKLLKESVQGFSLVFMDCQMPVLDGYQATEKIRQGLAGENNKNIHIIAMTANAMKGDKEKCLSHGMDDYISKPINIDLLKSKMQPWFQFT